MTSLRALSSPLRAHAAIPFLVCGALALGLGIPAPALTATVPERGIYRVDPAGAKDLAPLLRLGLDLAGYGPGSTLDFVLTPAERDAVAALGFRPRFLEALALPSPTAPRSPTAPQSPLLNPNLGDYHTYDEAHAEMVAYVATHPSIALLDTIGVSLEGRAVEAVKISDNVATEESEPEALIVGCHHARELMSVELPLYVMRRLLDGYGSDPVVTALVDAREIWIVPILNPDGHVYVQGHATGQPSGWWRKNRRPNADGSIGVDLNRNYSYRWGWDNVGSSPIPSSEVYRGTGAFSEPETAALRDFMTAHAFAIAASFHSYGELFLYPWGYAQLDTPDHAVFHAFGDSVAAQNGYRAGNPKSGAIYLTNGDMDDWVYGDAALKPSLFGFTFELNTSDQGGFAPPDGLIPPTCALNWGPVLTLLRYADEPRRVLPPARPEPPWYVGAGGGVDLYWSYLADDPRNPAVRHDVRRIAALTIAADDAEAGVAAWDSAGFSWSAARSASGTRSFWSGAANNRSSVLTSRAGVDAGAGDSLAVQAHWELESEYDYWYAEASADGGGTWSSLAGNWTTSFNPFGKNQGNGVTGGSGGAFRRAAFAWGPLAGKQVLVRFRCVTDGSNFGEGLYLDDIAPTAFETGITDQDTQSAERIFHLSPAPSAVTWFQVRAVDAEGQPGAWSARSRYEPGITAAEPPIAAAPRFDRLFPNAPNPFNPRTELRFSLGAGAAGAYRLELYDSGGRRVALLRQGWDPGLGATRAAEWDGRDDRGRPAASGVYMVRLQSVRGTTSSKITLLR